MDMMKVLADLRVYKGQLDDVIAALDRLARQRGEKRGRPLKASGLTDDSVTVKRRRRRIKGTSSKEA
jgi:hypothetical protein